MNSPYVAKNTVDAAEKAKLYVLNEAGLEESQFEIGPVTIDLRSNPHRLKAPIRFLKMELVKIGGDGIPVKTYEVTKKEDLGYSVDFQVRSGVLISAPTRENFRERKELAYLFDGT